MTGLISLVALSVLVGDVSRQPGWQTDYGAALAQGVRENKPLAVFIGSGHGGWDKVAVDGKLSKEAQLLLGEKYVSVYLNTDTVRGKELATAFELPVGVGLVLSDRVGEHQAFWHQGALADGVLTRALARLANSTGPLVTTETNLVTQTSYYGPVVTPGSSTPIFMEPTYRYQSPSSCSH